MTLEDIKVSLEHVLDTVTVGSVIGYVMSWFTVPNLVGVFTLIWAIARAFESVFGKPIYVFFKTKRA